MSKALLKMTLSGVLLTLLSACTSTAMVSIDNSFPDVVSEPRPLQATLVLTPDFRSYSATPNKNTNIDLGSAQSQLLEKAFRGLFEQVVVVSSTEQVAENSDLVIIPNVQEVQVATPSNTYLNVYEVWIKYALQINTAQGQQIERWFMPAYGKTPDSFMLSRSEAIRQASIVALRDAGAKLMMDFYRIRAVHDQLKRRLQSRPATEAQP